MRFDIKGIFCFLVIVFILIGASDVAFADPETGKTLFREKGCKHCHRIENPGTVFKPICPGLKGVKHRHTRAWLQKWLKDPAAVWATQDEDVQDILKRYFEYRGSKPRPRESFMATIIGNRVKLSKEEIEHLIDYLETL